MCLANYPSQSSPTSSTDEPFSTWAHEAGYNSDAIERQLAHAPADKVKAAYLRSEFMELRATMMQAWADWLDATATTADMIALHQVVK